VEEILAKIPQILKLTGLHGGKVPSLTASRAEKEFGIRAQVSFEEGLKRTIAWYKFL